MSFSKILILSALASPATFASGASPTHPGSLDPSAPLIAAPTLSANEHAVVDQAQDRTTPTRWPFVTTTTTTATTGDWNARTTPTRWPFVTNTPVADLDLEERGFSLGPHSRTVPTRWPFVPCSVTNGPPDINVDAEDKGLSSTNWPRPPNGCPPQADINDVDIKENDTHDTISPIITSSPDPAIVARALTFVVLSPVPSDHPTTSVRVTITPTNSPTKKEPDGVGSRCGESGSWTCVGNTYQRCYSGWNQPPLTLADGISCQALGIQQPVDSGANAHVLGFGGAMS
jgi:hypothetical protein